jgi:hypothetical protein
VCDRQRGVGGWNLRDGVAHVCTQVK